jgi:hypothetical protein
MANHAKKLKHVFWDNLYFKYRIIHPELNHFFTIYEVLPPKFFNYCSGSSCEKNINTVLLLNVKWNMRIIKCSNESGINKKKLDVNFVTYDAMQSKESQLTFWTNILPPSPGLKTEQSKKPEWNRQQAELTVWPRKCRQFIPPKCKVTFTGPHTITTQNKELFITTPVKD